MLPDLATQPIQQKSFHLPQIDILRAVAILLVFCSHYVVSIYGHLGFIAVGNWYNWDDSPSLLSKFFRLTVLDGTLGVSLFFVISGLCIRLSHLSTERFSLKRFYWRRFWRIYPPYFLAMILFLILQKETASFCDILTHGLLVHNFTLAYVASINSPFWSLALEMQLYWLYPVLLFFHNKWGIKITCVLLMLLALISDLFVREGFRQLLHLHDYSKIVAQLPTKLWFTWYAGFLVADRIVAKKQPTVFRRIVLILAICAVPLVWFYRPLMLFHVLITAIVLMLSVEEFLLLKLPENFLIKTITFVGLVSFSFYLYFDKLIFLLVDLLSPILLGKGRDILCYVGFPIIFITSVILSYMAYRLVELPSIAFGSRLYTRLFPGSPRNITNVGRGIVQGTADVCEAEETRV